MKKIKLFALAIMAMLSTNAFAKEATPMYPLHEGIRYYYDAAALGEGETGVDADHAIPVVVYGVDKTKFDFTSKAVVIPEKFSTTNEEGETANFKVIGFNAAWTNQANLTTPKKFSFQDVHTLTALTIKIDNFAFGAEDAGLTNAYAGLEALATLTIIDSKIADKKWAPTEIVAAKLALTDEVQESLTTLNIGKTGVTLAAGNEFKVAEKVFDKLTAITLPEGLTEIGASTFEGFAGTTITLPETLTTIGKAAFKASKLTAIDIPEKVTAVDQEAFRNSEALKTVTGMEGMTTIPRACFAGTALESITIGEAVESIANLAFKDCKKLATVTIAGEALASIGYGAFQNCELLETLDLSKMAEGASINANVYVEDVLKGVSAFAGCKGLKTVTLSENITRLGDELFADCPLTSLNAPKVSDLGMNVLGKATKAKPNTTLETLVLGDASVSGFGYFQKLKTVTLGAGRIAENAFEYCTALETVTVGAAEVNDYVVAGDKAFYYCTALTTFTYSPTSLTATGNWVWHDDDTDGEVDEGEMIFEETGEDHVSVDAFLGCSSKPLVKFVTSTIFQAKYPKAPHNTTYGNDAASTVKTSRKATTGPCYGKYEAKGYVKINPEDAKVYSVYVDKGVAKFIALITIDGMYELKAGDHVILKTAEPAEINVELSEGVGEEEESSVLRDAIVTVEEETPVADYQETMAAGTYLYRLTNGNAGFGFSYFTGTTMKAGQFFIKSTLKPDANGRLQVVWLDENGNPEEGTTAIQGVEKKVKDGAIYNLQGVRVNAAKKGLYIQDGKKFIVK